MGYVLQNKLEVSIFFEDFEYPLEEINILNYLVLIENATNLVPTINLGLIDQSLVLQKVNVLQDATKIRVNIRSHNGEEQEYNFRLFSYTVNKSPEGDHYDIHGYFDNVQYWLGRQVKGISDTSNNVISNIAQQCGLDFEGDITTDKQLWLPINRTNAAFVKYVAKSGWRNDSSYMVSGLTLKGKLLYKDITRARQPKAHFHRGDLQKGLVPVIQHEPSVKSGINNTSEGYRAKRIPQGVNSSNKEIDKLQFTPDSSNPLLNTEVRKQIAGNVSHGNICFGNNHKAREKAIYQNQRYANLYSYGDSLLIPIPLDVSIFDNIEFTSVNQVDSKEDVGNSGNLIITAKTIYIAGGEYYEKYVGVRHGTNQDN